MSSGQMFLTIAAFMLFGVVNINLQQTTLESAMKMDSNTYMQQGIGIARSIIDEIQQRKFDAACATKILVYQKDLTSIGCGTGEYYPNFNDVDDFDGSVFYSPAVNASSTTLQKTPRCLYNTAGYTVKVKVQYVNPANPETLSYSYTFAKRVTVSVSNSYANYTITSSYVATY